MKSSYVKAIAAVAMVMVAGAASAQLGSLTKSLNIGTGGGSASAEQIVAKYVGGTQSVMRADANMLAAVGLKDEAEKASVQAKNLTEGATKGSLEEAAAVRTSSSEALERTLNGKKIEMDAASKKQFANGVGDLAKGVIQYVDMSKDVSGFKPGMSSFGAAAGSAIFVAKNLPDSIKNLGRTLKTVVDFSKANNIPVPKEATDATSLL
ncbi:hypothetical protein [Duganella violaceipulchra]|uniref:DUF4197 family protein n=1 Tax=Duganella violaceipulchra TaxID=2849652 RepID=A0AA41H3Y5_9BURK|nr:hypothetical protein [Duganella violaceicalia]MBV6320703.1 hypothetical protein [Duganella violaceicalia]MCP2008587.1 hypothetical protein [Duganella violaceicalia]